jgi:hypothetical protein
VEKIARGTSKFISLVKSMMMGWAELIARFTEMRNAAF